MLLRVWNEDEMEPITDVKNVSMGEVFTEVRAAEVYENDFEDGRMHHLELMGRSNYPHH